MTFLLIYFFICFMDENNRFLSSPKSNILVINAIKIPAANDVKNVYIQYMFNDFNNVVETNKSVMNDAMLAQNEIPNFKSKILFAIKNCIAQVAN